MYVEQSLLFIEKLTKYSYEEMSYTLYSTHHFDCLTIGTANDFLASLGSQNRDAIRSLSINYTPISVISAGEVVVTFDSHAGIWRSNTYLNQAEIWSSINTTLSHMLSLTNLRIAFHVKS